jgi:hypothetical protein
MILVFTFMMLRRVFRIKAKDPILVPVRVSA